MGFVIVVSLPLLLIFFILAIACCCLLGRARGRQQSVGHPAQPPVGPQQNVGLPQYYGPPAQPPVGPQQNFGLPHMHWIPMKRRKILANQSHGQVDGNCINRTKPSLKEASASPRKAANVRGPLLDSTSALTSF